MEIREKARARGAQAFQRAAQRGKLQEIQVVPTPVVSQARQRCSSDREVRVRHVIGGLTAVILVLAPVRGQGQAVQSGSDYVNRGNERLRAGNLDGAIADYTEAIELDGSDSVAYYD